MFFHRKKIRQLNQMLDAEKKNREIEDVTQAIENAAPASARPAFQKHLRQQLLLKFHPMAAANKNAGSQKSSAGSAGFAGSAGKKFHKGWAIALAVLVLLVVSGVASYPLIPAPEVQGYSLKDSVRKISYNAPIEIVFSQGMDHGSVDKAFKIDPKVEGAYSWQNNTFIFTPATQFKIGDSFKVSVDRTAKSMFQKSLSSDYEENFVIVAAPQVSLFSPAPDSKDVPVVAKLTVHFDRPMIALTTLDQSAEKAITMKIEPAVTGKVKWLGTSSMSFVPDKLTYATHYTVTIPQGTVSAEGGATDKDFTYGFDTLKPAFVSSVPNEYNIYNGPNTVVQLTFNQAMNLEKASNFVHLYKYVGNVPITDAAAWEMNSSSHESKSTLRTENVLSKFDAASWKAVDASFHYYTLAEYKTDNGIEEGSTEEVVLPTAEELQKTLILKPTQLLDENSVYFVKIDKDFGGAEGTLTLGQDTGILLKTVGDLKVVSTTPQDGAKDYSASYVSVLFNQPMDQESLQDKVVIEPKELDDANQQKKPVISTSGDRVVTSTIASGVSVDIQYPFLPSTNYKVTVKAGGKSVYGKTIDKDIVLTFKTAQLDPAFNLVSSPDISVLDATKPRVYYVKSTNVDTLHFEFKKLSEEEFKTIYPNGYVSDNRPADGYSSFDKKVAKNFNKRVTTMVDLEKDFGQTLTPGYYYFEVTSPQVFYIDDSGAKRPRVEKQVFVLTANNLAIKLSKTQMLVWATSMKEGAPVAGMDIQATNTSDQSVFTGKTDKDGLAVLDLSKYAASDYAGEFLVTGRMGDDVTLSHSSWSDGVSPWNFNIDYSASNEKYFVYLYTDRPIYRPGDAVDFKGLVRINNDMKYALPDRKKVKITMSDSNGQEVFKKDLDISTNGTFNGELPLGDAAATGDYQITASLATGDEPQYAHVFYQSFKVAAYRKPDYKMTVTPDKDSYVNGETAKVKVNGQFFFGAPLADAPVIWTVQSSDYYFFLPADSKSPYANQWFSFSDEGYLCYWGCSGQSGVVSQGKGKLDANGDFTVELPLNITDKKMSQFYSLEATAFDLNNQSVSNRSTFAVQQGEYYVGIMAKDYLATKGKDTGFELISVDKDGNPVAGKSVEVSLMKREWNTIKKKQVDSGFYYDNNFTDTLQEKKTVVTDDKGHADVSFAPKSGGDYQVTTLSTDSRGNKITSATGIYVTSEDFVNWGQQNNDRIELVPDKQEYNVGDTAHILVKSPYQNVYALVTHERANVVFKQVMKITSNSTTIDVPITSDSLPNEFVSILLVKGNGSAAGLSDPGKEIDERDVAAFKMGYTTLQVDTSSRKLGIDVTSDQPKYHPGDEVTLNVKTVDASGKPVKAEVSVSVVDESVLSLTENVTANLLTEFYRKRYLGIETATTLTKALSRLNVQVESGLKGGGGGLPAKRGTFKDTAYWQAVVNTDANGDGTVKFKLPDNLTTWQVLAIGITNDTLVGSKRMDFLVTKDIIARPVLPRFLIVNDTMTVGAVVHNYLDHGVDLNVGLKATGVTIQGGSSDTEKRGMSASQSLHLEPGKEQRVDFNVSVLDQTEAVFDFSAIDASGAKDSSGNAVGDVVENKIPIHPFSFPEVVATSSELNDNTKAVEKVWLPSGIDLRFGSLKISAASTLAGTFADGIQYLVQFPYGCAEQTASSLLPNLAVKEMAKLPGLGVGKLIDEKQLEKNVQTGLQALYKYQQSNGGWGLWENSEPTPYLSTYVLYTLYEAQKAGYSVDKNVMQRGTDYVKNAIKNLPLSKDNRSNANSRSFALFVLAEMQQGDLGLTNNLYDFKGNLNLFGKAYLAMALQDLKQQAGGTSADVQQKIDTVKGEILNVAKETPRGVHFEESDDSHLEYAMFDSNERTTALVLQMLSRVDKGNVLIPKILRNMLMEKKDGHFATTQVTAVSLLALADYLKSSGELQPNYNGVITLNSVEKLNKSFTQSNLTDVQSVDIPLSDLLPNNQDNEIAASRSGVGKMYFDMNLKYYLPTEQIASRDEGIFVNQEYFTMDDKKQETPVVSAKVGDNLVGKMTIIVPEDRYYVMVEDYLPAGLEGVDFNLLTSQQTLQDTMNQSGGDGKGLPCMSWDCWEEMWRFNHSEVRDDRMMFFADFLPKGVYELKYVVRATTQGTFHDLPALAQETYFPEVFGRSDGKMFTVQP